MLKHNKRSRRNRTSVLAPRRDRIQELVEEIRALHNPQARQMLHETLESVLEFYGHPHPHPHHLN